MIGKTAKLTRMELLITKKKLKLAKRGHKLLKDKRDELMKNFLPLIRECKSKRDELEKKLDESYKKFFIVRAFASIAELESAFLSPSPISTIKTELKNIIGVDVPILKLNLLQPDLGYSMMQTPIELDNMIESFQDVIKKIVDLAELEQSCELLAMELEKTRRRVNALEHVLIPQLENKVKYIEFKL